jgi:hypothetical protein
MKSSKASTTALQATGNSWQANSKYVEAANKLLDELGMTEKDADGFRMGPDGNPSRFWLSMAHA